MHMGCRPPPARRRPRTQTPPGRHVRV